MTPSITSRLRSLRGQSTVEAVFVIPVLSLAILLVLQPIIIAYDRLCMENAALEACRILETYEYEETFADGSSVESFIRRRLSSIPPLSLFHFHEGGCSYAVSIEGDASAQEVTVRIENDLRLLPFIGQAAVLLGASSGGLYHLSVEESVPGRPSWTSEDVGSWDSVWKS